MLRKLTTILLVILLISSITLSVFADTLSNLKDKQDKAEDNLKDVKKEQSALMKEIQQLSDSIADNEDKLYEIKAELKKLEKEIKQLTQDLKTTEEKFTEQEDSLKKKISELKKFYNEEKTPIVVSGKVLKNREMDEIVDTGERRNRTTGASRRYFHKIKYPPAQIRARSRFVSRFPKF